ncbi:hypothetical protein BHE74_00042224 [Ensete ventricosum]|nr:hypothetical protein BHE74_00042224 [Ensete ventricosum]
MHQEKPRHSDFIFRRKDPLASKRTDGLKDRPDREAPRARGREGLAHRFPRDLVRNTNDQGPREQGWACCHMLLAWVPHVEALDKLAQGVEMKGRSLHPARCRRSLRQSYTVPARIGGATSSALGTRNPLVRRRRSTAVPRLPRSAPPLCHHEKKKEKKKKKEDEHMVLSRADVDDDRPDPIGVGDTARCQSISMARSVPRPTPGTMNPHL